MGAKGAVEIIFRGKDVAEREKEYTELFCNPLVSEFCRPIRCHVVPMIRQLRLSFRDGNIKSRCYTGNVLAAKMYLFYSPPCTNIKTRCYTGKVLAAKMYISPPPPLYEH